MMPAMILGFNLFWHLPILVVVISLVYSATRYDSWGAIFLEAFRWGLRMTAFLGGIWLALYLLNMFISP